MIMYYPFLLYKQWPVNILSFLVALLVVMLAGGGFKHGQHLAFDAKSPPPLSNLYVTMLQRMGIEAEAFASSSGSITGLETA